MAVTYADAIANTMLEALASAGLFVSLHSADPGKTGAAELSGDGYAREASAWGAAATQILSNASQIAFGPATLAWTAATHFGVWTAVSGGTFLAGDALNAPVTVEALGDAVFATGALKISLAPFA